MQSRKSTIDLNLAEESKKDNNFNSAHEKKSKHLYTKTNSKAILNRADIANDGESGEQVPPQMTKSMSVSAKNQFSKQMTFK
jgi:hypothetical protein